MALLKPKILIHTQNRAYMIWWSSSSKFIENDVLIFFPRLSAHCLPHFCLWKYVISFQFHFKISWCFFWSVQRWKPQINVFFSFALSNRSKRRFALDTESTKFRFCEPSSASVVLELFRSPLAPWAQKGLQLFGARSSICWGWSGGGDGWPAYIKIGNRSSGHPAMY